jgi:hypothetical protein
MQLQAWPVALALAVPLWKYRALRIAQSAFQREHRVRPAPLRAL